jgi:leucine dehydrogenase
MTIFNLPDFDAHEGLHFFDDRETGMRAIIAVHSTHLGPAAGGCRYWDYADDAAAITDALRLSRGMSYKNAMAGLPMGGGKAVLLKRPGVDKSDALLERLGVAINTLGGRYVTAEDVGMTDHDMTVIARRTKFVSGLPVEGGKAGGNPGPSTAEGVFLGMRAAVRHKFGREGFDGIHVAIQGLGSVGYALARLLAGAGAKLTVADIDADRANRAAGELRASVVGVDEILAIEADVLAPCALGAILNERTIPQLAVAVVAGAANNQLATEADGERLFARGILYAPDYVINAGGIINVVAEYLGDGDAAHVRERIARIETRLADIFERSDVSGMPTDRVADAMARELIGRG